MKQMMKMKNSIIAVLAILAMVIITTPVQVRADGTDGIVVTNGVVTGYFGTSTAVTIPDNATSIADRAFSGKPITSVVIPSSITSIGSGAFENCSSLGSVTVPASVTSLGTGVFSGCGSLSSASLQASIYGIPDDTFNGCSALSSVSISSNIASIGSRAFKGCSSLSTMTLPSGVTAIGSESFANCTGMTGIAIPESTTSISLDAFRGCASLNTIKVAAGNGTYGSDGGCLYNGSYTKLLIVPAGKSSVALNSSTKTIGSGAFNGCYGVSTLTVPSGTTQIESGAFSNSGITTITIPASVNGIGDQSGWTPEIIYGYSGTEADSYASSRDIVFYPLDGNADETDNDGNGIPGLGTNETIDDSGINVGKKDNDKKKDNTSSNNNNNNNTGNSGYTGNGGNGGNGGGYSSTNGNTSNKDTTPKTGDFLNARVWVCVALILVGMAFFIVAMIKRKNKD